MTSTLVMALSQIFPVTLDLLRLATTNLSTVTDYSPT